jgi:hypothetical protein
MTSTTRESASALREVRPEVMYPLPVLQGHTGLGSAALRQMRREGLAVRYISGRVFVLGRDFIEHVLRCAKDTK